VRGITTRIRGRALLVLVALLATAFAVAAPATTNGRRASSALDRGQPHAGNDRPGGARLREPAGVRAGPRLLRFGRQDLTAYAEGFVWPENPEFFWRFGVRRNPRTMAGVTADGRPLLVTVDGRAPATASG
jgi:hypothetical protein